MANEIPPPDVWAGVLERVADLCHLAVARTCVDGIAVSLVDDDGALEPVLETDEVAQKVSSFQFTLGEGPGCDAAATGEPVLVPDLMVSGTPQRWPTFAAEASGLGIGALFAFPLGSAGVNLGSALFYRKAPGGLEEQQLWQAIAASELLGLTLVAPGQGAAVSSGLRMEVHQAAGMVMLQTGGTISDALVLLKATAFSENLLVTELADAVISGVRRFSHIESSDGGTT